LKRKKLLTLVGSICLILVVAALLLPACAKEEVAPAGAEEAALKAEIAGLEGDVAGLEKKLAAAEATAAAAAEPAKVYEWRMTGWTPPGDAIQDFAIETLADYIEWCTQGRVKLTVYGGGVLYPPTEGFDACGAGTNEISCLCSSYFRGTLPSCSDDGVPMMYANDADVYYTHYELGLNELKQPEFNKFNTYLLGPMPVSGSGCGFMSVDPIRTLDDFKGVSVRSFGAYLDWCEALGMKAVFLPHDEVYMALKLGTLNAYLTVRGVQWSWKGHEVCNYYYFPGTGSGTNVILTNLDAWNSITPELQSQLLQAAKMHAGYMLYVYGPVWCEQATAWFDEYGLERITWGPEVVDTMYEKAEVCWEEFAEAAPPVSKQLMDIVMGYNAKKRAGELP